MVIALLMLAALGLELAAYLDWSVQLAVTGSVAAMWGAWTGLTSSPP